MPSRTRALGSSVGSKILIGLTGFLLVLYLLIHIAGNLVVFGGPAAFNKYAYTLESSPLLPVIEIALLLLFLTHILRTLMMFFGNRAARPVAYVQKRSAGHTSRKTLSSSTMVISGLWLVAFLVVHVKAFRFGVEHEWPAGGRDLYRLEMDNLRDPLTVGFYVLSMFVVGSHLFHGVSSAFQSLGLDHPRWTPRVLLAGKILAIAVAGGFILIALWAHFVGGQVQA